MMPEPPPLIRPSSLGNGLMRYAALNQGGDDLASYNDFVPAAAIPGKMPPPGENLFGRYSDEQLYALARFAPSLVPPPNPNVPGVRRRKGTRRTRRKDLP